MALEEEIKAFIAGVPAIAAVAAAKVYPVFAPESATAPYVVYRRTSTARTYKMGGTTASPSRAAFSVTCWASTWTQARDLADAIRAAVGVPRTSIALANVQGMQVADEADSFEPSPELLVKQLFGRELIVQFTFNET